MAYASNLHNGGMANVHSLHYAHALFPEVLKPAWIMALNDLCFFHFANFDFLALFFALMWVLREAPLQRNFLP